MIIFKFNGFSVLASFCIDVKLLTMVLMDQRTVDSKTYCNYNEHDMSVDMVVMKLRLLASVYNI